MTEAKQQDKHEPRNAGLTGARAIPGLQLFWKSCSFSRRYLNHLVFWCLILLTAYLCLGRILMPLIGTQKDWLQSSLIETLGLEIRVGELSGDWFRFSPILRLNDIEIIQQQDSQAIQSLGGLDIALDIPQSLWQRELVINQVNVNDMSLVLLENAAGDWNLSGFQPGGDTDMEALLNLLFNTSRLQLAESNLILQPFNAEQFSINNIYLDIQNRLSDHQAQLQFRLNDQDSLVQMAVRLDGNPMQAYSAEAYLDFDETNLLPLLASVLPRSGSVEVAGASGQLWLLFNEEGITQAQGSLDEVSLIGEDTAGEHEYQISTGSIDLAVRQNNENNWDIWASNLEFDFFNRPWESGDFFINVSTPGEELALDVKAETVDLAILNDMLELVNLPEQAQQALRDLRPRGQLRNMHLQTDFSGSYPGGFSLAANLDQVAVDAWTSAPSGQGINAYVEADMDSGFVELDSGDFSIHLPRVFADGWTYSSINGRVHWAVTDERVRVYSDTIDARNPDIHGRVKFDVRNQRTPEGGWDSNLTLLVGALDFNVREKSLYLPTLSNIRNTMDWLDTALLSGQVENSGFVFRGKTTNLIHPKQRTVKTFYQASNASLQFLQSWPPLEEASAFVYVRDNVVDVTASSARIGELTLGEATASIRPLTDESGSWLALNTEAVSVDNAGLNFLRETPIRETVGNYLDGWELDGEIGLSLSLGIPLNNNRLENEISVVARTADNTLRIPEYDLSFTNIRGSLRFSESTGLNAQGLSASLFDFPLAVRIENSDSGLKVFGNGRVSRTALQGWSMQPQFVENLLDFTSGEVAFNSELTVLSAEQSDAIRSRLDISSDLLGLSIELPQPFDKSRDENAGLALNFNFSDRLESLSLNFRDQLSAVLHFDQDELQSGVVNLGPQNEDFSIRTLNDEPGLLINGNISDFNLQDWQDLAAGFADEGQSQAKQMIRLVDVEIGNLHALGIDLPAVVTVLEPLDSGWSLYLENEQIQGDIIIPDEQTAPYEVQLSYLRLPRDEEEPATETDTTPAIAPEEERDVLAAVNPAELPAINFSTEEFSLGDGNLGAWSFQLRSNANGANISDLRMQAGDAVITDRSGEGGASLNWQRINGVHQSSFNGLFAAGDLAEVLPSFGYGAVIQSESARFQSDLAWEGSPAFFAMKRVSGQVDLQMQNGSFIDIDSGSTRLFGAFNFDALVRRLQLDFSDLYERGLAYDNISGMLNFNEGIVRTRNNFLIRGPSSTINVTGQLDLVQETIDADVLVNLPLGQNVSMVAGILGAWPIAITTYVASVLFRDQLENFTTVLYRLEGPWDDPQAGFESDNEAVEEAMEEVGVLEPDAG